MTPNLASSVLLFACLAGRVSAQTQFEQVPVLPANATAVLPKIVGGDFDGDGDLDLFAAAGLFPTSSHALLRNDGRGRFVDATPGHVPNAPIGSGTPANGIVAFDMDGDGDLDLFVGLFGLSYSGSRLLANDGSGTFTDVSGNLAAGSQSPTAVVAADFDGDGDLDLAFVSHYLAGNQNALLRNNGAGVFAVTYPFPVYYGLGIAAADIDGDGDPDLAISDYSGVRLLRNDGNLVFTDVSATWLPALPSGPYAITFGDVDGDGDPDLVAGNQTVPVDHVLRNAGGSFTLAGNLPSNGSSSLVLADVDGDGDLDLVRACTSGTVGLALNDGAGVFTAAPSRLPLVNTTNGFVATGDLDGDGDVDLVVANAYQPPSLLRNRHRHIEAGPAVLGQVWSIDVWSTPGYATLDHQSRLGIGLALLPQPLQVPAFGGLWLDLGAGFALANAIVPAATGRYQYAFAVPSLPPLAGLPLHVQALLEQAPGPARLAGFDSVVIQ